MDSVEDLQELMSTAGSDLCPPKISKAASGSCAPTPVYDDGPDDGPDDGNYVQYSRYADGWMPCQETRKALAPGAWTIYETPQGPYFAPMRIVTDDLLRLPDSKSDEVIEEIEKFWTLKDVFAKYGYSHKRGFLLWGPQGSGKTSTVNVVTQQMIQKGGVVFIVGDVAPFVTALMLGRHRSAEPNRPVVVILEDIDSIINRFGEHDVLSLLDGEKAINNVVYIATTNYPERLEPRVINRPSRFDQVVKIGMPNDAARKLYLESRNLELSPEEMENWVFLTKGLSIAHIKELIISVKCYGVRVKDTVERLRAMANIPKSDDSGRKTGFSRED